MIYYQIVPKEKQFYSDNYVKCFGHNQKRPSTTRIWAVKFCLIFQILLGTIFMVKLRLASPRIPAWNITLAIHFLLRLFFFVEFRPGEITMNEFLGNNRSPRRPPSTSASKNIKMLGILVTAPIFQLFRARENLWVKIVTL